MDAMTLMVALLWLAVVVLALLVWALSRQVGVLFERVAPMGALVTDAGPAVGDASPLLALRSLEGKPLALGGTAPLPTLVFFLAPTCPVCKKLIPVLKALLRDEQRDLRIVLASDGDDADAHRRFVREQGLDAFPYVLSTELGMTWRVSRLPYAVLLDARGHVASKGLVNSREQLDSLLNAHDMGKPSIQSYLGDPATKAL